jgi:very-short-patch-repair endonuclease
MTSSTTTPTIHAVNRLTPKIVEVVVHAPAQAENFQPGQFYRLQNYEAFSLKCSPLRGERDLRPAPAPQIREGDPEKLKQFARELRKNQTDVESQLWGILRNRNFSNYKFRRQHKIGNYIVDFVCLERKLVIELDGSQHSEQKEYDKKRDNWLVAEGYRVLRFWNHEVYDKSNSVLETIYHSLIDLNYTLTESPLLYEHNGSSTLPSRESEIQLTTTLAMEGLAMTGAWVDKKRGLIATIALEMGGSSNLMAHLKPGEPVVLMGPTGTPTEIPHNETLMLIGGGLGNAVLFSIGKAARENGCRVLYFAGYKKAEDRYKIEEIEAASDVVVWACDEAADFTPNRPQDRFFHGNIVEAIAWYARSPLRGERDLRPASAPQIGEGDTLTESPLLYEHNGSSTLPSRESARQPITLDAVDRIIAIGSDRMMEAVAKARHGILKPYLKPDHIAIGSINSPMQCMMKEICAQCLQKQVNPITGAEEYVYSCFNQDQLLDWVSFPHLNERLKQNSVQEKLTAMWISKCLNHS